MVSHVPSQKNNAEKMHKRIKQNKSANPIDKSSFILMRVLNDAILFSHAPFLSFGWD